MGGGIRTYEVAGRPVLDPYPVEQICDGAHGAPLVPWPNRLDRGRYEFEDRRFQLPLTEPEQNNAIHGFLRWVPWSVGERRESKIVMEAAIAPRPGYPFALTVSVGYELGEHGLRVTTAVTNEGEETCPVGHGQHPYLSAGGGLIDDCQLELPGRVRILTDERQLPAGREAVAGTPFDFLEARRIGEDEIDFAFTDLIRDRDGKAWTRLTRPDGSVASIWVDHSYSLVEIYTGHTLAAGRARKGLGTEPMTCAPDAFNNGEGLIRLGPGETASATWGAILET